MASWHGMASRLARLATPQSSVARSRDLSLFEGFLERKGTKGFLEKMRDFFEKCKNLIFYGL